MSSSDQAYVPIPSDAMTTEQWRAREQALGCVYCEQKGCDRMNHGYSLCPGCGSPYCNGDACPGPNGRFRNCPDCGSSPHEGRC